MPLTAIAHDFLLVLDFQAQNFNDLQATLEGKKHFVVFRRACVCGLYHFLLYNVRNTTGGKPPYTYFSTDSFCFFAIRHNIKNSQHEFVLPSVPIQDFFFETRLSFKSPRMFCL